MYASRASSESSRTSSGSSPRLLSASSTRSLCLVPRTVSPGGRNAIASQRTRCVWSQARVSVMVIDGRPLTMTTGRFVLYSLSHSISLARGGSPVAAMLKETQSGGLAARWCRRCSGSESVPSKSAMTGRDPVTSRCDAATIQVALAGHEVTSAIVNCPGPSSNIPVVTSTHLNPFRARQKRDCFADDGTCLGRACDLDSRPPVLPLSSTSARRALAGDRTSGSRYGQLVHEDAAGT